MNDIMHILRQEKRVKLPKQHKSNIDVDPFTTAWVIGTTTEEAQNYAGTEIPVTLAQPDLTVEI